MHLCPRKECKVKKEKKILVACYYSNSYPCNVNCTVVFPGGGHFFGQMGDIQNHILIINNQSSQPASGWPLPLP